ncbi:MAG TPA: helix-turn-helix transcriptional regulator [Solirubrobacteraceae bacterium]|nr:helix-turn-helix transcriptional regulator [Solirubrobacteraceae bacterium]
MARTNPSYKLTTTENALLGMLARYGEHSGYELLKLAGSGVGYLWSPAKSHVYDVLPRLERAGYARRQVVEQTEKPDKHLWRITASGRAALRDWIDTIDEDSLENRGVLLLKLFFGEHGDPERLVEHLERFRDQARQKLAVLRRLEADSPPSPEDELPLMTLRQGLIGTEAQLRWAEEVLPGLRARAGRQDGDSISRSSRRQSTTGAR